MHMRVAGDHLASAADVNQPRTLAVFKDFNWYVWSVAYLLTTAAPLVSAVLVRAPAEQQVLSASRDLDHIQISSEGISSKQTPAVM